MGRIWRSNLPNQLKLGIFKTVIETILMYGSETWRLSARIQKRVGRCYTSLLRRFHNISWRNHPTLQQIYGDLPRLSSRLIQHQAQFAVIVTARKTSLPQIWYYGRSNQSAGSSHSQTSSAEILIIPPDDLGTAMGDRDYWRSVVRPLSATAARWWWWHDRTYECEYKCKE